MLAAVSQELNITLEQSVSLPLDDATVQVDGATPDRLVLVEVFARIGKLRGGQLHKVSTDALKLIALKEAIPEARLVLAFADQIAADSIVGWRKAVLERNGVERLAVALDPAVRKELLAAQAKQKMINLPE